jgi:hypothetical protein
MKTRKPLFVLSGIILAVSFALFSCSTTRKTALACPDFSRYPTNRSDVHQYSYKNKNLTADNRVTKSRRHKQPAVKNNGEYLLTYKNSNHGEINASADAGNETGITKTEFNMELLASLDNHIIPSFRTYYSPIPEKNTDMSEQYTDIIAQSSVCDTIVLNSGSVLTGKVEEIGQTEVKYRKCNNLNGPVISILRSDIKIIKYSNGTFDSIASDKPIPTGNPSVFTNQLPVNAPAKTEGLAIAGFVSGLVGLFIAGIPLGTLGVIFGAVSLNKMKKYPGRFKGRGLAIASIVLGFIAVIGAIIVISAM